MPAAQGLTPQALGALAQLRRAAYRRAEVLPNVRVGFRPSLLVCWLAACGVAACRSDVTDSVTAPDPPPVAVQVYEVRPERLVRTVDAVGTLRSPQSTQITAEVGGKVVYLDIPEGKRVDRGHVLAKLDTSQAAADLAVARARLQGAETTLGRKQKLIEADLVSAQALDEATAEAEAARGEMAKRRATLDKMVIRAPFEGVLGLRDVSLGAYVSPGTPVTRITGVDQLELVFSVPERQVPRIRVGQKVRGVVGGCTSRFSGEVAVLEPAVDPTTRALRVMARVDRSDALRPGMSARVLVEVGAVDGALRVPQEALIRQGTRQYVYVVTKDGRADTRNVRVGQLDPEEAEITKGLEPGDRVVVAGHQKVRPGRQVEIEPFEPVDNPNLKLGLPDEGADCWF